MIGFRFKHMLSGIYQHGIWVAYCFWCQWILLIAYLSFYLGECHTSLHILCCAVSDGSGNWLKAATWLLKALMIIRTEPRCLQSYFMLISFECSASNDCRNGPRSIAYSSHTASWFAAWFFDHSPLQTRIAWMTWLHFSNTVGLSLESPKNCITHTSKQIMP